MRASGVFRRGPLLSESADDQALRLPGMPQRGQSALNLQRLLRTGG